MNDLWEGESPRRFAAPPFDKGGFGGRGTSGEPLGLPFKRAPSSASLRSAPSPLKGEGFWAATRGRPYGQIETFRSGRVRTPAPTAANGPGALVRQSQARLWSRSSDNFCIPRAQWPGGSLDRHSDFARRKFCTTYQEGVPRNGGPGKAAYGPRRNGVEP